GHSDDLTARLDLKRGDELGELATEFDHMVERLTAARRELVDQSFDAGIAEMSREVLHNIGNALTPLCINVSLLQERLRAAPLAETQMALGELDTHGIDPARRTDLQQFVQLAVQELVRVLMRVLKDLESMEQQTDHIQQSLAEQMKYSRPNRVSETVRLADVVAVCVESMPDPLRQRLFVQVDESVPTAGSIHTARTTLQRIFQILMHNAAEAMPAVDSGSGRGTLRISATVEQCHNGEHVRVRFVDDGAGIAPEHLARLFEKGFSTKSRERKSGVGLHWAANATIALGGTIRAESPGPNQGAIIELTIPLQRSDAAARAA
ncbi:MAG: ATP-binding protein, partial [Steroidobacteraceae bacterium]